MAKLTGVKTIDMVGGEITKVEYNGELYAKVEGDATSGDILLIVEPYIDTEKGNFYFARSQTTRSVVFDDDVNDTQTRIKSGEGHFIAYRKVTTQPASLESRVETLETKVAALEGNEVGDGEYRKVTGRRPRVGDFVKYNSDNDDDDITVGKFYEVVSVDYDGDPRFINNEGDETYAADYENWDLYEKVGAEDESTTLRVGDYAKVVDDYGNSSHRVEIGTIVRIKETNSDFSDQYPIEAEYISGEDTGSLFHESDLDKATDAEVAEAKLELAEARAKEKEIARWSAIGRKPNEYKKGDIVRVKDTIAGHPVGTIGELVSGSIFRFPREFGVEANGKTYDHGGPSLKENIELITPVESRFDR